MFYMAIVLYAPSLALNAGEVEHCLRFNSYHDIVFKQTHFSIKLNNNNDAATAAADDDVEKKTKKKKKKKKKKNPYTKYS